LCARALNYSATQLVLLSATPCPHIVLEIQGKDMIGAGCELGDLFEPCNLLWVNLDGNALLKTKDSIVALHEMLGRGQNTRKKRSFDLP
jgi:hypothetical protein